LATRNNASSFTRRFFADEKGKAQVHLIEPINEGRKKALMGLEKSLYILEDAVDVMAQTKPPAENTTHPDISINKFKEMAKAPKENKKNRWWRSGLQNFLISKDFGPYLVVKDVGSQKVDITIG